MAVQTQSDGQAFARGLYTCKGTGVDTCAGCNSVGDNLDCLQNQFSLHEVLLLAPQPSYTHYKSLAALFLVIWRGVATKAPRVGEQRSSTSPQTQACNTSRTDETPTPVHVVTRHMHLTRASRQTLVIALHQYNTSSWQPQAQGGAMRPYHLHILDQASVMVAAAAVTEAPTTRRSLYGGRSAKQGLSISQRSHST